MARPWVLLVLLLLPVFSSSSSPAVRAAPDAPRCPVPVVTRDDRRVIAACESGSITAVDVDDGYRGPYHLRFFTLEPRSLLLPLLLHADMVFYVHTGRGTVTWVDDEVTRDVDVGRGDVYRIDAGAVVYVRSHPDLTRQKLRLYALFGPAAAAEEENYVGAYSSLSDLVRGFDEDVLRMAFRVPQEVVAEIKGVKRMPPIVPMPQGNETDGLDWKEDILQVLVGGSRPIGPDNGKKKTKKKKNKDEKEKKTRRVFNIIKADPDVENCNGRSIAVTNEDISALSGSDIGLFMVKLTRGCMTGPHWNTLATVITMVTHGRGMVQVVSPTNSTAADGCPRTMRYRIEEGDVFVVPRYHPVAQMSFNDDYLTFVGFSTRAARNHPQYLAGKSSPLLTLKREILALSLGVPKTTVAPLLAQQEDSIMLECTSCAEEEEKKMEAESERQKEEEEAKKEEEARKREEKETKRKEDEARKREEEEARRREEEAKKREEEEAKRREEEAKKKEEEEARRRKEEEETRKREEENARRKEEKEDAKRRKEEEEARKREEEEEIWREEETRRREEEEDTRRREEEEEEDTKRREDEEEDRKREEEIWREEEERRQER